MRNSIALIVAVALCSSVGTAAWAAGGHGMNRHQGSQSEEKTKGDRAARSESAFPDELVTLSTREGVTQSYLLEASGKAEAVAILFPGGAGAIHLRRENGQLKFGPGNFLVRSRGEFVRDGIAVAVVDAPSDQPSGMSDFFRSGADHAKDIDVVVRDLKTRFPALPVFLIGTSRGTVSAAYVGRALGPAIAGTVLTSAVYLPTGGAGNEGGPERIRLRQHPVARAPGAPS